MLKILKILLIKLICFLTEILLDNRYEIDV